MKAILKLNTVLNVFTQPVDVVKARIVNTGLPLQTCFENEDRVTLDFVNDQLIIDIRDLYDINLNDTAVGVVFTVDNKGFIDRHGLRYLNIKGLSHYCTFKNPDFKDSQYYLKSDELTVLIPSSQLITG